MGDHVLVFVNCIYIYIYILIIRVSFIILIITNLICPVTSVVKFANSVKPDICEVALVDG